MPPVEHGVAGKKYWRSLNELSGSPEFREFVAREFPAGASEMLDSPSRRSFLRIMGASLALAGVGATSCSLPKERVMPFAANPANFTPGIPKQFATTFERGGFGLGLLATSYDGRPVKLEGNPLHPSSLGATDSIAQAVILGMYDPDRSQSPARNDGGKAKAAGWAEYDSFAAEHFAALKQAGGRGLAVLTEQSASPSLTLAKKWFREALPQAGVYQYDPISHDAEADGARILFGAPMRMLPDFSQARVVLSLDCDFLMTHPAAVANARGFAIGRDPEKGWMNRLYVAEAALTVTGSKADHRMVLRHSEIGSLAVALIQELAIRRGLEVPNDLMTSLGGLVSFKTAAVDQGILGTLANDLSANMGKSIVIAGQRQAPEVHALAFVLNSMLGNIGSTVQFVPDGGAAGTNQSQSITELTGALNAGSVETILILGGNPAYDAPADLGFAQALSKAKTSIHASLYLDETSRTCNWHLPLAHFLESWGDARGLDGTVSIVQPLIDPLFGGRTAAELLAQVATGSKMSSHDIVREAASSWISGGDFDAQWRIALQDGIIAGSAFTPEAPHGSGFSGDLTTAVPPAHTSGFDLIFVQDYKTYDGRFANNGWLQELPDPITKVTWDNPLLVSYQTAQEQGLRDGDMVRLDVNGASIDLPVLTMPGQQANTLVVSLGYGRMGIGRVGSKVGFDTYKLRTASALHCASGASITKLGKRHILALTQDHFALDSRGFNEREARVHKLIREASFDEYKSEPNFATAHTHSQDVQLWALPVNYDGHSWGMTIDLNACTGCGACISACQAENNIPIVGKSYVKRNREMHWIRIDRYFSGDPEAPEISSQPVTCHHCDNAPCEQVCPVGATQHSHEGLNDMVYNRCIGTRYCSNNCPYKVRRFNYLNYRKHMTQLEKLGSNPEVTVRSRGVMEKCTYCVQRIQNVKIKAKREDRQIADLEIVTACMGACPSQAISFGDLNDPHSRVSQLQAHPRAYHILEDLMTKPRTKYLAKLRNPAGGAGARMTGEEHGGESAGGHG